MLKKDKVKALEIKKEELLKIYSEYYLEKLQGKDSHYETNYFNPKNNIDDLMHKATKNIDLIDREISKLSKSKIEK